MGEGELIDILDPEYAMPGEIERQASNVRRQTSNVMRHGACEPWPETAKRQIAALESRVHHLECLVQLMLNAEDQER